MLWAALLTFRSAAERKPSPEVSVRVPTRSSLTLHAESHPGSTPPPRPQVHATATSHTERLKPTGPTLCVLLFEFNFSDFILNRFHAQRGAEAHDPETKTPTHDRPRGPGAPASVLPAQAPPTPHVETEPSTPLCAASRRLPVPSFRTLCTHGLNLLCDVNPYVSPTLAPGTAPTWVPV